MFSNLMPYVCCNIKEFEDERIYLKENTFPKLSQRLKKLYINFDPVQLEWDQNDNYLKSGHLLRLLLHNIQKSSPFFIGLLGSKYGDYLNKKDDSNLSITSVDSNQIYEMSWLEKNLVIASQTGFNHIINPSSYNNSILEHQINMALSNENSYAFYRFYFRKFEYLEEKFSHFSIDERKKALEIHGSENEYCESRIKELKMKIAKKGLIVKYYKSLEELGDMIYDDFIDMVQILLSSNSNLNKQKNVLKIENLIFNKLNQSIYTDSLKNLYKSVDMFLKLNIFNNNDNQSTNENLNSVNSNDENEDYLEILKLRHINLAKFDIFLLKFFKNIFLEFF